MFIALLSDTSVARSWVLQEIGYATALKLPILPLSSGPDPDGLIHDLHALEVKPDWSNLEERLAVVNWSAFTATDDHEPPSALATLARSSLDRVRLLVSHAKQVKTYGKPGMLRQRAGLTSFSIPDAAAIDPVWIAFDGANARNPDYHRIQRQERRIFEDIAREFGCRLIINPHVKYADASARSIRLQSLRAFLADTRSGEQIQAIPAFNPEFVGNVTILGDWWVAESLLLRSGGFREATFIRQPQTVKRFADDFDEDFDYLCAHHHVSPEGSRLLAIQEIDGALQDIETGREPG